MGDTLVSVGSRTTLEGSNVTTFVGGNGATIEVSNSRSVDEVNTCIQLAKRNKEGKMKYI